MRSQREQTGPGYPPWGAYGQSRPSPPSPPSPRGGSGDSAAVALLTEVRELEDEAAENRALIRRESTCQAVELVFTIATCLVLVSGGVLALVVWLVGLGD